MARVQFINAIVSGKVGGAVYAHNKAGSYIRILRKPTNPKSMAQVSARSSFGSGSNLYRSCTIPQRAAYNTFASVLFNPLKAKMGVVYSGQQAANALNIASLAGNSMKRVCTILFGTDATTPTLSGFAALTDPPSYRLASQLSGSLGEPINLSLVTASVTTAGLASMEIATDFIIDNHIIFANPNQTEPVGFSLYMSNPYGGSQQFVTNKFFKNLGTTGVIDSFTLVGGTPGHSININFTTSDLNIGSSKSWITIGNKVRLTAVLESKSGQLVEIGSFDFTVVA